MSLSNLQTRRATVDDLAELRKIWRTGGLSVDLLERQLRDFQIVETADGTLLGALALQIEGQQGRLHSECYAKQEFEAEARQRLWERANAVARNYGLYRIWIDFEEPFWKSNGFEPASLDLRKKLPGSLGNPGRSWHVLKLRDETMASISVEREFELFSRAQRDNSDRFIRQAQTIKNVAYLILLGVVVLGLVLIGIAVMPSVARSRLFRTPSPQPENRPSPPGTNSLTPANDDSIPARRSP